MLTVNLNDIHHEKYSLEEKVFQFSGVGGADAQQYSVELQFYKDVIPQVSSLLQNQDCCMIFSFLHNKLTPQNCGISDCHMQSLHPPKP